MNQISVYAAVTDWCYQFGFTNEEKKQVAIPVDNGVLTMVEPEEVEMLVSHPNLALGNKMQGSASFRILGKRIQMTQFCEKALFQHLVTPGNCHQIRPDSSDGWREITPLCRKYTSSRAYPKTKALAGTTIGPITEVHAVEILDEYGLEVAIPSICKPGT